MPPDPARLFPGGTAVTHLAVYDWSSPDGLTGGSAHVHLACTEGYVVLGGQGRLQTLSPDGYAETPLAPMTVAWFSPGVIHRLVNEGDLRILVVMQNGGLPEAGDCVLTFPPGQLADPQAYRQAASLAGQPATGASGASDASQAAAARHRKNLAVRGFLDLRERIARDGPEALDTFYAAAAALVRDRVPAWRDTWAEGPLAAAVRTGQQLDMLADGGHGHLHEGRLTVLGAPPGRQYGNCGRLATYQPGMPR